MVPANGFYGWQSNGSKKQPFKIALRNRALIAFAGLWEKWTPERGEPVETFTIMTTAASKLDGSKNRWCLGTNRCLQLIGDEGGWPWRGSRVFSTLTSVCGSSRPRATSRSG